MQVQEFSFGAVLGDMHRGDQPAQHSPHAGRGFSYGKKQMYCLCQHFADLESELPDLIHCIRNFMLFNSEAKAHSTVFCCFAFLIWTWPSFCPPLHPWPPSLAGLRVSPSNVFISASGQGCPGGHPSPCWILSWDPTSCTLLLHAASYLSSSLPKEPDPGRASLVKKKTASNLFWHKEHLLSLKSFALCCVIKYSLYESPGFLFNSFMSAS